ncbi:hypothetical protein H1V43_32335 [Streptomyces sp. PSKA54]|uniref:Uncharacterized protein n=1 Tax=Streptomyces himalayensis subsp. aureolus TaxID=2758039 RepID=A0A7W2D720_9ACTN|nr:hypothetical protein [Streptomyces himalayensis]MBA4865953.1 hypothetical protein [Streptomyces himalayensis subsp. aureolus]
MGWSSANQIFNPVARALREAGVSDQTKRKVLGDLISGLQDGDWDTEDESLEDFLDDPAIVQAFADHDVHLSDRRCCRAEHAKNPAAYLLAMRHADVSEDEMTRAIDAYAHHLAERIRASRDETRGAVQATKVMDYAADLIDPEAQR